MARPVTAVVRSAGRRDDGPGSLADRALERQRAWQVAWPIGVMCVAMPPMFLLGAHAFLWLVPAVVFGVALLTRGSVRLPPTSIPLAMFLVILAWGLVQLSSFASVVVFGYRFGAFVSMYLCFLWIYQLAPTDLSSERLFRWMAALFITLIVFGWLGVIFGTVIDTQSPLQRLLPAALSGDEFFDSLSAWRFAEVQRIGGLPVPRPSAPLPYTNGWGSAVGLLLPFFMCSWLEATSRRRRRTGWMIAALAVVPITFSLNRGLFGTVVLCLLWAAWTRLRQGDPRWLIRSAVALAAAIGLLVASPLGTLVMTRLDQTEKSNDARASVYSLAWNGSLESPFLGHGAPRVVPGLPPIGTHGLVWYLMYAHGFVALALLLGSLLYLFLVVGPKTRTSEGRWARAVILVALMQSLIYGLLPQIVIVGIAAGIMCRDTRRWTREATPVVGLPDRSGDDLASESSGPNGRRRVSILDRL